jgi:tRNA1Val (adenine37-N6)-methyltransferase
MPGNDRCRRRIGQAETPSRGFRGQDEVTILTHDSIFLRGSGVVSISQPEKGVRFSLDSLLLADFCHAKKRDRVLELGTGTGTISLLLAKKYPSARFVADEVEPQALTLLCRNIERNGLTDAIVPLDRDIRQLGRSIRQGAFDVIIANPPYISFGTGRKSPSRERQTARQDQTAGLPLWLDLQIVLKNKGRYYLVFPARRAAELMSLLRRRQLEPKRLRWVHPYQDRPASLVLIEAIKAGGIGLDILPPLIVHEKGGGYTREMRDMLGLK